MKTAACLLGGNGSVFATISEQSEFCAFDDFITFPAAVDRSFEYSVFHAANLCRYREKEWFSSNQTMKRIATD
jgi:hypothetical protein